MLHRDRNFTHETNQTGETDWVSSDPRVADILTTGSDVTNGTLDAKEGGNDENNCE